MRLSWNEIRDRALKFSGNWKDVSSEDGEAQTFWNEFFEIFGIRRRTVASFEEPVRTIKGKYHFIDLFWKGVLLVEHKSKGKDLSKASSQAFSYIQDLVNEGRENDIPRFVVISDFSRFVIYDLESDPSLLPSKKVPIELSESPATFGSQEFQLKDLNKNIRSFAFLRGEKPVKRNPEDPANIEAAEIMGKLHKALESGGFEGHDLERFLVRILFCLFAEDSLVFEPNLFSQFILNHTREDGSDLGSQLNRLFEILNTPETTRQKSLDEDLASFPYVNGDLFKERLAFADFNKQMRDALISCAKFNWSRISPAVFGSMFQSIMEKAERRGQGAHYTSEADILKIVRPLFLDDLYIEFNTIKNDRSSRRQGRFEDFRKKLSGLKFLDPACGCGNFLVITYRELRLLELEVLKEAFAGQMDQMVLSSEDVYRLSRVNVDQMFGIELSEWPARIAEVALWLTDHQMNQEVSNAFHQLYIRIPLKQSPHIKCANALNFDWTELLPNTECSFILGNPPFVGKKARDKNQQNDMEKVFGKGDGSGVLDYVCCWYRKAAEYIHNTKIGVGFVSTNSISQGEQPGILWPTLFGKYGLKIWFGYRTFPWESEAKGKANVHVVIIGFGAFERKPKYIFELLDEKEGFLRTEVSNISPYISEGPDTAIEERKTPISPNIPEMYFGNMPNDDGNFLLTNDEKDDLIKKEPKAKKVIRPFLSSKEFLRNIPRWCIWLKDIEPNLINDLKEIKNRIELVKKYRSESDREATRKLAAYPSLFGEIRQPKTSFVLVPRHSSENRRYIPMSYFGPENIVADSCLFLPEATYFHFGILNSTMHMAWVRQICGRLESRYRYSVGLVYNNFPWPENPNERQQEKVEEAAKAVLAARQSHPTSNLADLYDPLSMPSNLNKAHAELDREVEKCYRKEPFESDRKRFEFLFDLYLKARSPLVSEPIAGKIVSRKRKKQH
ncbi:MAG TPA: DNA methyltransferase [bacterium]|nr:DNA methyltransferase [bacterium]